MGMQVGARGGTMAEINVTPLVDVVLVLLIIFMVITPILLYHLGVALPEKAEDTEMNNSSEQVVVSVKGENRVYINKEEVSVVDLQERLRRIFQGRAEKVCFFDAEKQINYGFTVEVMDLVKGAGVETIGLMTEK